MPVVANSCHDRQNDKASTAFATSSLFNINEPDAMTFAPASLAVLEFSTFIPPSTSMGTSESISLTYLTLSSASGMYVPL